MSVLATTQCANDRVLESYFGGEIPSVKLRRCPELRDGQEIQSGIRSARPLGRSRYGFRAGIAWWILRVVLMTVEMRYSLS